MAQAIRKPGAYRGIAHLTRGRAETGCCISLPSGAFKPYAGGSTAILLFTNTYSGGTDHVWFYDMKADGWSLDDKRQPLLPEDKLGVSPTRHSRAGGNPDFTDADHVKNNLPDVQERWGLRDAGERQRGRTE